MGHPFFPNLAFAWVYAGLLLAGLVVASWHDLRTLRVPKRVTLGLLGAGLVANLVRGAWLGAEGYPVWAFDAPGPVGGAFDGLLFAACGLLVGFAVFFLLWIFGVGGGGDVKLAAAVGAWVGPAYFLGVLVLAVIAVMVLTVIRLGLAILGGRPSPAATPGAKNPVKWRLMSFSLPMTLAVAGLLAIGLFGVRVQFAPAGG